MAGSPRNFLFLVVRDVFGQFGALLFVRKLVEAVEVKTLAVGGETTSTAKGSIHHAEVDLFAAFGELDLAVGDATGAVEFKKSAGLLLGLLLIGEGRRLVSFGRSSGVGLFTLLLGLLGNNRMFD